MPRKPIYIAHSNEQEELHTRQEQAETGTQTQNEPVRSQVSTHVMQRTIAHPGQARPQDLLAVSRTYGNQVVMRLVEKARLERQSVSTSTTATTIQRIPLQKVGVQTSTVQREGEDTEERKKELKKLIKKEKRKAKFLTGGRKVSKMFKELLLLPLAVVDQISILDKHVKDAYRYFKTGETRAERENKGHTQEKFQEGRRRRYVGRTGLRTIAQGVSPLGALHGIGPTEIPLLKSNTFNPFRVLNNAVDPESIKRANRHVSYYSRELWLLENPGKKAEEFPGGPLVGDMERD